MEIKALGTAQSHQIVRKQSYLSKGRTGREGSSLKISGALAIATGLVWAAAALVLAGGMAGVASAIGTLMAGAILLWSGLAVAKNSQKL